MGLLKLLACDQLYILSKVVFHWSALYVLLKIGASLWHVMQTTKSFCFCSFVPGMLISHSAEVICAVRSWVLTSWMSALAGLSFFTLAVKFASAES